LKIGIVSPNYLPNVGGTEIALFNIANKIADLGHEIIIVTRSFGKAKLHKIYHNPKIHRFHMPKSVIFYLHSSLLLYNYLKTFLKDVDIIHQFHLFRFGFPVYMFSKKLNKPLITSLMGTDTYNPIRRIPRVVFPYLSFIMNNSEFVTSPSQIVANIAYKQGCKKKIQIIPHGTYTSKFENVNEESVSLLKTKIGLSSSIKILLAVQRLSQIKRIDILIHAAKELREFYKVENFLLLIVGKGEEKKNLEKLVKKYSLEHHVKLLGFIPHELLPVYYKMADIFVFHSTFESFGLVLTEAMAAGKPIVSTKVGAIPEVVKDGETGFLVEPKNPLALATAIDKLIKAPEMIRKMGEKGEIRAKLLYNWNIICQNYINLYKMALANKCS